MTGRYFVSFAILPLMLSRCSPNKIKNMHPHTNELINETSPYLLQHAHNPVEWHAWSSQNLKEARKLAKPLLISIGYSSCHWCHVMEHESFVNEKIADYMNEHFYCIKVDREERPDVDAIYMTAANIITGSGGWPLNCFALPDGSPFHAGTYYPPNGWLKLLETVHQQYQTNKPKLEEYAAKLTQGIRLQETAISDTKSENLQAEILVQAVEEWKKNWDMQDGGMAKAPKFPMPTNYDFLLSYTHHINDSYASDFLHTTLQKMAFGGIFDQIGGGFSRYSVDGTWKVPHFEKMTYDNAQLLSLYAKAYKQNRNPEYLNVITKTVAWLEQEMLDTTGMFYAALDADSEGEEGKYYVWKTEEVSQLLGEDFALAQRYYNIEKKGLWEHKNNILLRENTDYKFAENEQISEAELARKLTTINNKLLAKRSHRIRPGLDDKCLTAWNALLVVGLLDAYKATQNAKYRTRAIHCLEAILSYQVHEKKLWHTYKDGQSTITAMLDSYAFLTQACLEAFYTTGKAKYYTHAAEFTTQAIDRFYDAEKELFYFNETNELIIRTTEVYDNVIPATNSVMVHNLTHLGLLQANTTYLKLAETMLGKVQRNIVSYTSGHSNWARAHLMHTYPFFEIVVVGENAPHVAAELQQLDLTNCIIAFSQNSSDLPMFSHRFVTEKTIIYVCKQGACQRPVTTIKEVLKMIQS